VIRHLLPHVEAGPWGGAAITNDGSPTGDEAHGRRIAFQWLGLMIEIGVGTVRPRPAAPTCATLPNDVTVEQAAKHLGIQSTAVGRVTVAHHLISAGFKPVRANAFGGLANRYVRSAAR
jgi:hypothetical protein